MTTPADERVTVGLVRGLHGLRGAVRVEVLTDDPERFAVGSVLFAEGDPKPLTVAWTGAAKPGLLVGFDGYETRESAESLRGRYLEVVPDRPLPEGAFYWHQIRGLDVVTMDGEMLGKVADVFRAGEGEVYVVQGGPLGEIMVPSVKSVVVEVDPPAGRLVVDAVALDLPAKPPRRRRRHELTRRSRKAARVAKYGPAKVEGAADAAQVEAAGSEADAPETVPSEGAKPAPEPPAD